jgi:phage terminase large subunit-like protein
VATGSASRGVCGLAACPDRRHLGSAAPSPVGRVDAARGQGKTSLTAVLALFEILGGAEGAQVVVVATDERQAGLCFRAASRMVELHSELGATVLGRLSTYSADHSADPLVVWREHSAVGFEDHPVDCRHCWELANPAGGDFVAWDGLEACLPPKMREASFRRARLCQLTDQLEEAWLPPSAWAACADATRSIPDGAEVVVAFDGSFNGDTTVLVVASGPVL